MQTIINQHAPEFTVQAFQQGNFKTVSNKDIEGKSPTATSFTRPGTTPPTALPS